MNGHITHLLYLWLRAIEIDCDNIKLVLWQASHNLSDSYLGATDKGMICQ